MHVQGRTLAAVALAAILGSVTLGCAVEGRYYDPAYHDYHRWNSEEIGYYHRYWDERREQYREYRSLSDEQQRDYWNWRHGYKSRDHEEHRGQDDRRDRNDR